MFAKKIDLAAALLVSAISGCTHQPPEPHADLRSTERVDPGSRHQVDWSSLVASDPPRECTITGDTGAPEASTMISIFAIDTSGSTRVASGIDIDRDGIRGTDPTFEYSTWIGSPYAEEVRSTDPGDTILAAEIAAACLWVQQFINPGLYIGVVSFSGPMDPETGSALPGEAAAYTVGGITNRPEDVGSALSRLQRSGSSGGTDYSAGIEQALLMIQRRVDLDPDLRHARKMIVFLTDGLPTLPVNSGADSEPGDHEAALRAAHEANNDNITIYTFAFGESAQRLAPGLENIAGITGGSFAAIRRPRDLSDAMRAVMSPIEAQ